MQTASANLDERAAWILNQTLTGCYPLCSWGHNPRCLCLLYVCEDMCLFMCVCARQVKTRSGSYQLAPAVRSVTHQAAACSWPDTRVLLQSVQAGFDTWWKLAVWREGKHFTEGRLENPAGKQGPVLWGETSDLLSPCWFTPVSQPFEKNNTKRVTSSSEGLKKWNFYVDEVGCEHGCVYFITLEITILVRNCFLRLLSVSWQSLTCWHRHIYPHKKSLLNAILLLTTALYTFSMLTSRNCSLC